MILQRRDRPAPRLTTWAAVADEGGQAIVLVAIFMMAMLFVVGLAIDSGQLFVAKRTQQEAADAAAFGGAVVLYQGGTVVQATQAAIDDAASNGYVDGVNSTSVTVNGSATASSNAPTSGAYAGESPVKHVEVIIVRQVKTALVPAEAAFNPVRARGVAGAVPSGGTGYAVITLASSGTCIFMSTGDGGINVNTSGPYAGAVYANCAGASAINSGASGKIIDPYGIYTVGNPPSSCCNPAGSLHTGQPPIADPFSGFPKPSAAGSNIVKACGSPNLAPGYYADLNTSTCSWHLTGGVYIIRGGNINVGSYTIDEAVGSNGVLIFMTAGNYQGGPGSAACGSIGENTSSNITLKGMNAGTWKNMVFYQDGNCAAVTHHINAGGGFNVTGTVYAPTATFDFNPPGTNVPCQCQMVVARMQFDTGDDLNISFDAGSVGATGTLPTLVE